MKFSVCIPNFNYARYIRAAIDSVLAQEQADFELLISDNASTDSSWEVITGYTGDDRVQAKQNEENLGFAPNIDQAVSMGDAESVMVLSSDDMLGSTTLSTYARLLEETRGRDIVVFGTTEMVGSDGESIRTLQADESIWADAQPDSRLSSATGYRVRTMRGSDLLRRSILEMKNPLTWTSTCFPRRLWKRVGGFGGMRLVNPDRWFHWRILRHVDTVCFLQGTPLAQYRWHASNQTAQQAESAALKYLTDEYSTTLQITPEMMDAASVSRDQVVEAFVEKDIFHHGLACLGRGERAKARRVLDFGRSVYPRQTRAHRLYPAFRALLAAGAGGEFVAKKAYSALKVPGATP